MIRPSARTRVTGSSPTATDISMMRDSAALVITMSLSTMCSANGTSSRIVARREHRPRFDRGAPASVASSAS